MRVKRKKPRARKPVTLDSMLRAYTKGRSDVVAFVITAPRGLVDWLDRVSKTAKTGGRVATAVTLLAAERERHRG